MKIFLLICLVTGLASSDKLDRTYLPPPGSKFSGGHPGDIQVPLEFPKETYLTGQPQPHNRIPELELGFSRRPKPVGSAQSFTEKPSGFTYFQNSYPVPTTTTSYAITQTTTFAPPEEYNGLDQSSSSLNGTGSKRPQGSGPIHQQEPNRGQLGNTPFYDQFGNNQQSLNPYGSTSQRPIFPSNRKPETYLPPVSSIHKLPGQVPASQNDLGYPSGQPQGTSYQDRQQYSSTYGPVTNRFTTPQANQRNQFIGNANVPVSTAAPQYEEGRFGSTAMPDINQERFSSPVPTQPNSYFPSSTTGPDNQDKIRLTKPGSEVQYQYVQNQNLPGSTAEPQYQGGQRIITPGLDLQNQLVSSTASPNYQNSQNVITPGSEQQRFPQNLNNYHVNHNFPTSTSAPRFQNGQQFTTPGSVHQNQYLGNQKIPSTSSSQYQDGQRFVKPGVPQETIGPNQEVFGTRIPSRQNQKQFPGNQSFLSSTETPHSQNGQLFTTPGSEQSNQYFGNQDIPSTNFPQYQDGQQNINRPGVPQKFVPNQQVFGPRVPSQQKENQIYPSTTVIPQFTDSIRLTPGSIQQSLSDPAQQNQYQYQGHQNYPSSTAAPQFITPGPGPSQFLGNQNIPTSGPQFQNSQRFNTPRAPEQYPNNYTSNENQQYPSTATPQYQSTFTPTPGPNQQGVVGVSQFPTQPNYNQLFPSSTTAPQQFSTAQAQYGNDGVQSVAIITSSQPGTGSQGFTQSFPEAQATSSTIIGALPIGGYPTAVSGLENQSRPERPQEASDRNAEILSYQNVLTPEGYSYSYDTSNGIHADETGVVGDGTKAQGGFSYTGDDGIVYSVFYSADENGFQPRGDHLPTPPPIPEAIQRVIEEANKDKESGIYDDGSYNEEKYGHMKYNGKSTLRGPKNKTETLINGEDTPNKYENRFGTQKKNQFTPEAKNKEEDTENEEENIEDSEIDGGDMKIVGEIKSRIQSKRPTKLKNITAEDKKANSRNRNNFKSHPSPDMENEEEEMTRDDPSSDVSDSDDDFDSEDESDGVNYKDDPNSRTDFHGTNKYLPNPKRVNKINQIHNRRPGLPKGAKQLAKEANKQRTPNNRKSQTHKMVYEDEQEYIADRIRIPSRKNKPGQKITDNSKFGQPDFTDINGGYAFDGEIKSTENYQPTKLGSYQPENKKISKSKHSKNKDETKGNIDEETGYEYTTPHRKFNSEEEAQFPTRTSGTENIKPISQKGSQTTLRPFIAPNVYGDDEETTDREKFELDNQGKQQRPLRPFSVKKGKYPGSEKESSRDNDYVTPEAVDDGQFGSTMPPTRITPTRRPFGRPQSTPAADYGDINANGQNEYNTPSNNQNSRRPGHKVIYNNNAPNKEVESVAFVSLTPLSASSLDSNEYQQSNQYHSMRKPTDGSFYEENAPGKDTIVRRPATNNISRIPSTTYRPNSFVDRTSPSSVTADGFGRPISSTTPEIISGGVYENEPDVTTDLRPGVGRFGVTYAPTQVPEYQGSTSAPIGEDFSGPKRPQGFDPETGYYYK